MYYPLLKGLKAYAPKRAFSHYVLTNPPPHPYVRRGKADNCRLAFPESGAIDIDGLQMSVQTVRISKLQLIVFFDDDSNVRLCFL